MYVMAPGGALTIYWGTGTCHRHGYVFSHFAILVGMFFSKFPYWWVCFSPSFHIGESIKYNIFQEVFYFDSKKYKYFTQIDSLFCFTTTKVAFCKYKTRQYNNTYTIAIYKKVSSIIIHMLAFDSTHKEHIYQRQPLTSAIWLSNSDNSLNTS